MAGTIHHINLLPFTVLVVATPGFHGIELFYRPEIWVPMMMEAQIEVGNPWLDTRRTWNTWVAGRTKPGVSVGQAEANLNAIGAELGREYPGSDAGLTVKLAKPGLAGDALRGPVKAFTLGVLLLAGLVPARQASITDPNAALKGGDSRRSAPRRWATRDLLVAAQVTVCVVLLSACLLSLRGLQQALTMPLGFDPRGVTVAGFELGLAGYTPEQGERFQQRA